MMAWLLQTLDATTSRLAAREDDKTGLWEVRKSYGLENCGDGKPVEGVQEGVCCCSNGQSSLLTDVRCNQNTACMCYCRADGWVRGENAITVAIITQISLPLYLSELFNTGINHHHIYYAASYHTRGRSKRTNIILSGWENNIVYRARTTIGLFNKKRQLLWS